jgi:hypothetical protein
LFSSYRLLGIADVEEDFVPARRDSSRNRLSSSGGKTTNFAYFRFTPCGLLIAPDFVKTLCNKPIRTTSAELLAILPSTQRRLVTQTVKWHCQFLATLSFTVAFGKPLLNSERFRTSACVWCSAVEQHLGGRAQDQANQKCRPRVRIKTMLIVIDAKQSVAIFTPR